MFSSFQANEIAGRLLAGLCAGLSYGWWMSKHTRHHQAPNPVGVDTDIESKVLSFTAPAAASRHGLSGAADGLPTGPTATHLMGRQR
jgi:fatty acid desaturase